MILTSAWPYIFSCQNAQAANQLLLSPYKTIVVLLSMPLLPSNSSSFLIGTMSRISVSQSSVVQFHPAAPGTWPWSYAVVSTSTSTTRTPVSAACCATQSVVTRTLGIVAADINASFARVHLVTSTTGSATGCPGDRRRVGIHSACWAIKTNGGRIKSCSSPRRRALIVPAFLAAPDARGQARERHARDCPPPAR